ncbi:hypothetical protein OIDMADRAFT_61277 [Oidiodendron maius Zn]|uniref:Xylanolytic transcriptional activator regulatory domain-containing protein n=1 Tax=Oidiodendron maius (strain Zn) TaxID=913774 RepID=A0A0C3GTD8_OIDMZ|nr:hypothetical protein OIDMADRAFT_61277 [Oidiodendron maius Zn]
MSQSDKSNSQSNNSFLSTGEQTQSTILSSAQHYDLTNTGASTGGDPNQAFDTSKWTSQMGDNLYFPQNAGPLPMIRPLGSSPSTNQEDLLDYLAELIPDIWMTETVPSLGSMQDSMMLHNRNESVPRPTEESRSSIVTDYSTGHVSASANDVRPVVQAPDVTDAHQTHYRLDIPTFVVDDLIDMFFKRINVYLQLFHQPKFYRDYVQTENENRYTRLSKEAALVIYGMLALSARYSTLPYFDGINAKDRGTKFSRWAHEICYDAIRNAPYKPSLLWLQGAILLSYYNQSCRPALGCDLTVAACVRWAYDLELNRIDEYELYPTDSSHAAPTSEQWATKEEQRRAWWVVWELDSFDSVSSRRPFSIDQNRIFVLLPVSDEAWLAGTPVESAALNPDLLQCWKVLRDSPNQSERAWFLISNFIAAQALELSQQRHIPQKNIDDIETVVGCFSLLFHEKFGNSFNQLTLNENDPSRSNWIVLSRLMIQTARVAACILNQRMLPDPILTSSNRFIDQTDQPRSHGPSSSPARFEDYRQAASEVFRIYQSWPPEILGFVPPTMVSIIVGPAAIMLRYARHFRKDQNGGDLSQPSVQEDLLHLILGQFARYWNIGSFLLDFVRAFHD